MMISGAYIESHEGGGRSGANLETMLILQPICEFSSLFRAPCGTLTLNGRLVGNSHCNAH